MLELLNKSKKTCKFNDNIIIYETYAPDEYDRRTQKLVNSGVISKSV